MENTANQIMVRINGSQGEGGGQILRTALALSALTGRSFAIDQIRAKRERPGLQRQHLTAVQAIAAVCDATIEGAELGSTSLSFCPGPIKTGNYCWPIGSAGSTSLVLQTVLFPLLLAEGESRVSISGGTHNSQAPTFEFLSESLQPLLAHMGYTVDFKLIKSGYYPAGGGEIQVTIQGNAMSRCEPFELLTPGVQGKEVYAWSANIPDRIGKAEVELVGEGLDIPVDQRHAWMVQSNGPGNAVSAMVKTGLGKRVFTSFGERRLSLEKVAAHCVDQTKRWLKSGSAVDEHLQDQLLLPLSLGKGGRFTSVTPTEHTRTNMAVIRQFLPVDFSCTELGPDRWEIAVQV